MSAVYDIVEVMVTPRLVAGVRATVARGRVGQEFRRYLELVYAAGRAGQVVLDGQNIFIYRDASEAALAVEFCVGANAPFQATGSVEPIFTPGGPAVMTTHIGDYSRLVDANAALREWCRAQGRASSGPSWEVYGHWEEDPARLRTEVYYLRFHLPEWWREIMWGARGLPSPGRSVVGLTGKKMLAYSMAGSRDLRCSHSHTRPPWRLSRRSDDGGYSTLPDEGDRQLELNAAFASNSLEHCDCPTGS